MPLFVIIIIITITIIIVREEGRGELCTDGSDGRALLRSSVLLQIMNAGGRFTYATPGAAEDFLRWKAVQHWAAGAKVP